MSDVAQINTLNGFHPYNLFPQIPQAPVKFGDFRHAVGAAINRVAINDLAFQGKSYATLQSTLFLKNHPWSHPDPVTYTDDPQGNVEEARQILEDAGFGWDGDGNLRYPADADLSPLWPARETPHPAHFPFLQ
jgi:peptide/nickel transport system substrate-binding protein